MPPRVWTGDEGRPGQKPGPPLHLWLTFAVPATRATAATDPASLDALHRLAVAEGIVSPFSSMIVLVNDAQRKRLEDLSKGADRFERELEAGAADDPAALVVTAVPEPEEWLLLVVALLLLAVKWGGWCAEAGCGGSPPSRRTLIIGRSDRQDRTRPA